jgi:hypothetical protein
MIVIYQDSASHIYLANTNVVAGFLLEKRKLSKPVRGIAIGGNLFELLQAVDKVASDLTWFQSTGCPTFLVSNIKIGGSKQLFKIGGSRFFTRRNRFYLHISGRGMDSRETNPLPG